MNRGSLTLTWLFLSGIALVTGCTHAGKPYLTTEERAAAHRELASWPEGKVCTYPGDDNVKLRARFYGPADSLRGVVVALHGLETNSKWYAPLAKELAKRGIAVLAIDRRGNGLNANLGQIGQMGPRETYQLWLRDIGAAMTFAARFRAPMYLLGNSWGGNPALAWSDGMPAPKGFRATILLTPGLASYKPTFWQQLTILVSPDQALLGTCLSTKDYSERRSTWALLEEDPSLTHEVSARFFKQTQQMRQNALGDLSRIRAPLLLILAGKDELMKNGVIQAALNKGTPAGSLRTVTLANDYHLVLLEHPREVAQTIAAFAAVNK